MNLRTITKFYTPVLLCLFILISNSFRTQNICNTNGNLVIFTNYDGGNLHINIDQNIPNIKIGIVSYEACAVNLTGAFVGNVTEVRYAGYNDPNNNSCSGGPVPTTTIIGAGTASTSILYMPTTTLSNSHGYGSIVCGYSCDNNTYQGGCNTVDQIEAYFLGYFANSTLYFHKVQYGCWTGTHSLSAGGSCCPIPALLPGSISGSQSICATNQPSSFSNSVAASGGAGTISYTWQSSTTSASSGFVNIAASNSTGYTPSTINQTTWFRRAVSTPSNPVAYSNVIMITVLPPPNVTIGGTSSVCAGSQATLTAHGALNYTWTTAATTSAIVVSPNITMQYMVIGAGQNGCVNMASKTLIVYALPVVTAVSDKPVVCEGGAVVLSATGGATYTWQPGNLSGSTVTVFPVSATGYTVTGADINGCSSVMMIAILTVSADPVSVSPASLTSCAGETVSFAASGSGTYTWQPTMTPGNIFTATPNVSTTYTVIGSDQNACTDTAVVMVDVLPVPVVSLTSPKSVICRGETVTVTAHGAAEYKWQGSTDTDSSAVFKPNSTGVITVTGTATNECSSTATAQITVDACSGVTDRPDRKDLFTVYPNPSGGSFTIRSAGTLKIQLINSLGQVIAVHVLNEKNNFSAGFSDLPEGIYFITSDKNGNNNFRKVVVRK